MANQSHSSVRWSIITVAYNSADVLRRHWASPLPNGVEWIVVDNDSSDSSAETARELGARVIELEKNLGFSAANNRGLKTAEGSYIAFVNPDVVVDWPTLDRLEALIDATGGLVSPQLLNPDGSSQPNGRGAPSLMNKIRNRTGSGSGSTYQVVANKGQTKYVAWLIGAVVAGAADTVQRLGGWDESYFLYYEDKDLSLRAWRNGVPVLVDGDISWRHSWARATKHFAWAPWKREVASAFTFYRREPRLLVTSSPSKRNRLAFERSGSLYYASSDASKRESAK